MFYSPFVPFYVIPIDKIDRDVDMSMNKIKIEKQMKYLQTIKFYCFQWKLIILIFCGYIDIDAYNIGFDYLGLEFRILKN